MLKLILRGHNPRPYFCDFVYELQEIPRHVQRAETGLILCNDSCSLILTFFLIHSLHSIVLDNISILEKRSIDGNVYCL